MASSLWVLILLTLTVAIPIRADLFIGGVIPSILTAYNETNPNVVPEVNATTVTTPELYPVQNGLATETNISCPYQFRSNQIVTITADNVTSSNIRAVNGALTYVEFYQINTLETSCNFADKSYWCGLWNEDTTSWIFTDCTYKYESSTDKCICNKFGTIGLFISTKKTTTETISPLTSITIGINTDYSAVANTISTVFNEVNLYYEENPNNVTSIVIIVNRILLLLDDIIGLGYIDEADVTGIFAIFDAMFSQSTTFFQTLNKKNNYASEVLTKFETIFRTLDVSDNFEATGSIFKAFATKPSVKSVFGITGDQSNALTASRGANATDDALFAAFFDEIAVLSASPNLRIFFLIFESTSAIVQSLSDSLTGCEDKIVSSKMLIAKTSAQGISAVDNKLFTAYFYQNNTPTVDDCVYYTDFTFECVYLDTSSNKWNTKGCTYSYSQNMHQCSCSHLTAFALSASGLKCEWCPEGELSTNVIGAGIFILCAIFAIVILIIDNCSKVVATPQQAESSYQHYPLFIIFLINLIFFNTIYIVFGFLNFNLNNTNLCEAVGILLHFFLITTFGFLMFMCILRYIQIYAPTKSIALYTGISTISLIFFTAIIVMIAIVVPSTLVKYISPENRCWLHDGNLGFAIVPAGVFFLVSFGFIVVVFFQLKFNFLRREAVKSGFDFFVIILVCLILASLTWFFGFMAMFPTPRNILHLNFVFSLMYCLLNVSFGIFVLVAAIILAKMNKQPNRVGKLPAKEVIEKFEVSPHRSSNLDKREHTPKKRAIATNRAKNSNDDVNRRRSAQKLTLTPVE